MEAYCFAPLFNFNTKVSEIKLSDGCVLGPPTDEEKQVIRDQAHNFAIRLWPKWKFVGRTGLHMLTKDESGDSDWGSEVYGMHRAMTVFKSGRIGLGPQYRVQTVPCKCIGIGTPNPVGPNPNREVYTLSRREGLLFSAFYDKFRFLILRSIRNYRLPYFD